MPFRNKSFWMPVDTGCLADAEMGGTSSGVDLKRRHQWFMSSSDNEPLCNKKQAIESSNNKPASGTANVNISLWDDTPKPPSFSGNLSDHLFSLEPLSSSGSINLNLEREGFEYQYGSSSSASLSMSQFVDTPFSLQPGIGSSKTYQVSDSGHHFSSSEGNSNHSEKNNFITLNSSNHCSENSISLGPDYINGNGNLMSLGPNFSKMGQNYLSVDQPFSKRDGNFMLMGQHFNRRDNDMLIMGQQFDKDNCNIVSTLQQYKNDNGNSMSIGSALNQVHENFTVIGTYDRAGHNFESEDDTYEKDKANTSSLTSNHVKEGNNALSLYTASNSQDSSSLLMGQKYNKVGLSINTFGDFQNEPTGRINNQCDLSISQSLVQASEEPAQKNSMEQNTCQIASGATIATTKLNGVPKNKEKKISKIDGSNHFPSNVKSLLSTGIFNGVPVMYVSWSREKKLPGFIKDSSYLCGCKDCKLAKPLNAYEFERHAGCKTKHPNNHIYFENGKTIYGVVQELKSTPQEKLFETIDKVTGSPINEKNFRSWKASYEAATRELQRIYGKDGVAVQS